MPAANVPFGADDLEPLRRTLTDRCPMGTALACLPYNTRSRAACGVPAGTAAIDTTGEAA